MQWFELVVGVSKLHAMYNGLPYRLVTDSPYFYLSLTAMTVSYTHLDVYKRQLLLLLFINDTCFTSVPHRTEMQNEYDN